MAKVVWTQPVIDVYVDDLNEDQKKALLQELFFQISGVAKRKSPVPIELFVEAMNKVFNKKHPIDFPRLIFQPPYKMVIPGKI